MQKVTIPKRLMTLFLVFVMVLGLLPVSNLVVPANAADARSGPDDVVTINRGETEFFDDYTSPVLGKVIPRNLVFEANGQLTGGFCGDHSKEYSPHVKYINPTPISETKYAFCMPVLAQYAWNWFYSMELDERYPGTSAAYKAQIAKEERGSENNYWPPASRALGGSVPQAAVWLAGAGKISNLTDPANQRMLAEERNRTATLSIHKGVPTSPVEDVMGWIQGAVDNYAKGVYGDWDVYVYEPDTNKSYYQPMVIIMPNDIVQDYNGWLKIKKTDMSGKNLSGATFGVYSDSGYVNRLTSFQTTADEWTYVNVSEYMTSSTKTFYLKETSAPDGYVPNGKGYSVTVSATNNATKETAAAVNGGAAIKNGEGSGTPSGVVNKVDQNGNGIGPATFNFKKLTPNAVDMDIACDETGSLELQWTDPTGENYIEPGEYTVTEKIPPPGYEKDNNAQNLRLWIEEDDEGVPVAKSSGPITFVNEPKHSIVIQKVDKSGNGLPGAVFDIYLNGAKIDSATTGPDGTFTFAGTDGNGLEPGTYDFVEVQAPNGYLLPYWKCQSITIRQGQTDVLIHTLTFVNHDYPEIVIQKVSAGTEQPLAGAVFEVKIDETPIGTFGPTGPDGTIIIDHDTYGKYLNENQESWTVSVREIQAPDGYLIDDTDWKSVEFHRGQEMLPFVFTDTGYPEIVIRKSDRETEERLEGATFDIKIDAGASFSLTKQTDENGEIHITYDDYERFDQRV